MDLITAAACKEHQETPGPRDFLLIVPGRRTGPRKQLFTRVACQVWEGPSLCLTHSGLGGGGR